MVRDARVPHRRVAVEVPAHVGKVQRALAFLQELQGSALRVIVDIEEIEGLASDQTETPEGGRGDRLSRAHGRPQIGQPGRNIGHNSRVLAWRRGAATSSSTDG